MRRVYRNLGPYVLAWVASSGASTLGLQAQAPPAWSFRLEAGQAEIHRPGATGAMIGGALGRAVGAGYLRLDLAVAGAAADEGFRSLSAGPEVHLLPRSPVTPIAAAHVGLLAEPEYAGWFADVGGGLLVRANRSLALRGVVSRGTHGGASGPHTIVVGLEVAFGGTG